MRGWSKLFYLIAFLGLVGVFPLRGEDVVIVIPVKGNLTKATTLFVQRALKEADREQAKAVVLDMDTYGGELEAAVKIQQALDKTRAKTFTYINPNAGSAGAMIALSTRHIYMAPISAIGAAAPVAAGGGEIGETLRDKVDSYYTAYFESVAEKNGHRPQLAAAFISKEKEVKIGDRVIHPKGTLLSLSATAATEIVDGKPLLADGIVRDIRELLFKAGVQGRVIEIEPTGAEQLAFWITTLAPLFLMVGIAGVWLELKAPGFGIAGIIALVAFALFFFGHYVAGLAGWEAPVLFAVGLLLLLLEIFVIPGTMISGLLGGALLVFGIVLAMTDWHPQQWFPTMEQLLGPIWKLIFALIGAGILVFALLKLLMRTPLLKHTILAEAQPSGPSFRPSSEFSGVVPGDEGVAETVLRPGGKALIHGKLRDVISTGRFVERGKKVRVLSVEGAQIVVQPVETDRG